MKVNANSTNVCLIYFLTNEAAHSKEAAAKKEKVFNETVRIDIKSTCVNKNFRRVVLIQICQCLLMLPDFPFDMKLEKPTLYPID